MATLSALCHWVISMGLLRYYDDYLSYLSIYLKMMVINKIRRQMR